MSETETSRPPTPHKNNLDIRVTIDTDSLLLSEDRSGDAANTTSIAPEQGHMVVTASRDFKSQGAGDIVFAADVGDTLRFFISSGSNNFEHVVLIESISYAEGDEVLKDCVGQVEERETIVPESPEQVLPGQLIKRKFHFFQCSVAGSGTGSYDLVFALYDRSEDARPRLVSHYRWAIRLTAHSKRRES